MTIDVGALLAWFVVGFMILTGYKPAVEFVKAHVKIIVGVVGLILLINLFR